VRARGEDVELAPLEAEARRDQLGRDPLRDEAGGVSPGGGWTEWILAHPCRQHRHAAHRLDPARHHYVVDARHHAHRGEVRGLLTRAAAAVDRRGGHVLGKAGGQPGVASRAARLLSGLADTAHDHVLDLGGVHVVARHERSQRLAEQLDGMERGERAARLSVAGRLALRHRRPDGVHDHRASHRLSSFSHDYNPSDLATMTFMISLDPP
jgi:hypothetical protein